MSNTVDPADKPLGPESIDQVLADVIRDNPDKVAGWIAGEAGCWGFLAGQAVAACRAHLGRTLADQERRGVWHRLWASLEQIKGEIDSF